MIYKFINDIISYNLEKLNQKISYSQTGIDLILEKYLIIKILDLH